MTAHVSTVPPVPVELVVKAADLSIHEVEAAERHARAGRFGGTHVMAGGSDLERLAVLAEEFGEVSIEVCKGIEVHGQERREGLRGELIQVAAVALFWVAAIDDGRQP